MILIAEGEKKRVPFFSYDTRTGATLPEVTRQDKLKLHGVPFCPPPPTRTELRRASTGRISVFLFSFFFVFSLWLTFRGADVARSQACRHSGSRFVVLSSNEELRKSSVNCNGAGSSLILLFFLSPPLYFLSVSFFILRMVVEPRV